MPGSSRRHSATPEYTCRDSSDRRHSTSSDTSLPDSTHFRQLSQENIEYIPTRMKQVTASKPAANPLKFVKVGPCVLYRSAQEQLKKVEEVKKMKQEVKEEAEDWQSNLDNWKSSRRKRQEHIIERVVEVKKFELEEYDRNRRRSKTFNEMMEERNSRGRKMSLVMYKEEDSNDLSDLGIGTSSGKSSVCGDYDNQSVSDREEIEKHPYETHNGKNGMNGHHEDASALAIVSSPEPEEYTYERAIQSYVNFTETRVKSKPVGRKSLGSSREELDKVPNGHSNKSPPPPPVKPRRESNPQIGSRLSALEHRRRSSTDLNSIPDSSRILPLPKVDVLKRRELFEKASENNEPISKISNKKSSNLSNTISIKERLSHLEKQTDTANNTSKGNSRIANEISSSVKERLTSLQKQRSTDNLIEKDTVKTNHRLSSGDITSTQSIRSRLSHLEKQNSAGDGKSNQHSGDFSHSIKERLSSLDAACTKDSAKRVTPDRDPSFHNKLANFQNIPEDESDKNNKTAEAESERSISPDDEEIYPTKRQQFHRSLDSLDVESSNDVVNEAFERVQSLEDLDCCNRARNYPASASSTEMLAFSSQSGDTDREDSGIHTADVSCSVSQADEPVEDGEIITTISSVVPHFELNKNGRDSYHLEVEIVNHKRQGSGMSDIPQEEARAYLHVENSVDTQQLPVDVPSSSCDVSVQLLVSVEGVGNISPVHGDPSILSPVLTAQDDLNNGGGEGCNSDSVPVVPTEENSTNPHSVFDMETNQSFNEKEEMSVPEANASPDDAKFLSEETEQNSEIPSNVCTPVSPSTEDITPEVAYCSTSPVLSTQLPAEDITPEVAYCSTSPVLSTQLPAEDVTPEVAYCSTSPVLSTQLPAEDVVMEPSFPVVEASAGLEGNLLQTNGGDNNSTPALPTPCADALTINNICQSDGGVKMAAEEEVEVSMRRGVHSAPAEKRKTVLEVCEKVDIMQVPEGLRSPPPTPFINVSTCFQELTTMTQVEEVTKSQASDDQVWHDAVADNSVKVTVQDETPRHLVSQLIQEEENILEVEKPLADKEVSQVFLPVSTSQIPSLGLSSDIEIVSGLAFPLGPPSSAEPPKEKPPPPPMELSDEDTPLPESPLRRLDSTKRIKKEIRRKRSDFLGIEGKTDDDSYLEPELQVAPPPDMTSFLVEERRLEQQLYRQSICSESDSNLGETTESRDSGVELDRGQSDDAWSSKQPLTPDALSAPHSRQNSELYCNASITSEEDEITKKEREIIEILEKEEQWRYGNSTSNQQDNIGEKLAVKLRQLEQEKLRLEWERTEEANRRQEDELRLRAKEEALRQQESVERQPSGAGEEDISTSGESLRFERERLQQEQEELLRQKESLQAQVQHQRWNSHSALPNQQWDAGPLPTHLSLQDVSNVQGYPSPSTLAPPRPAEPLNYRLSLPDLQQDPQGVITVTAGQSLSSSPARRAPPPIPPAKPLRTVTQEQRERDNSIRGSRMPSADSLPQQMEPTHVQHGSVPVQMGGQQMSRQTLQALSAAPRSRFITNDTWIQAKKKPEGHRTTLNNQHWLIQEAEHRRITEQQQRNATSPRKTLPPQYWAQQQPQPTQRQEKPLPDAIIQTLTQRVQNRTGLVDNKKTSNRIRVEASPSRDAASSVQHYPMQNTNPPLTNGDSQEKMLSVSGKKKCSHCGDELGRGAAMIIESLRLFYHIDCFKCCVCHVQLGDGLMGTDVRVRNNKLHCHNCYSSDDGVKFSCV